MIHVSLLCGCADMRGSWRIDILMDGDKVTVVHTKRERSFEDSPSEYFEFGWSLSMVFDKDLSNLQVSGDVVQRVCEVEKSVSL
jgi:hypothetical protein